MRERPVIMRKNLPVFFLNLRTGIEISNQTRRPGARAGSSYRDKRYLVGATVVLLAGVRPGIIGAALIVPVAASPRLIP